tara:strand:- start:2759 stop:4276 length:1518 start_codon:yes stop_codon:yes gene_type:complete
MLSFKESFGTINFKSPLLLSLLGLFLVWFALFYEAIFSAARIWYISEIFSHGFFIIPGALYFIWRERAKLAILSPEPNYWVLLLLLPFLLLGVLGRAGGIEVFAHISAFIVLPLILWLILGNQIAKVIWFPLCFILFSIPIGEELVPFLQKITADMAIFLLNLTSVPSFNSGLYIEIPAGKFVVAEACSGIRFFIGSLVFGAVYSHISYHSFKRKLAFMLLAIAVPILANALRVFSIVLIGHFVDMKYASGADHLIYGWVFFGIVLFLLVLMGEAFRDKPESELVITKPAYDVSDSNRALPQKAIIVCGALLIALLVWQVKVLPSNNLLDTRIDTQKISHDFRVKPLSKGWRVLINGYSDLKEGYLQFTRFNQTNAVIAWYPQNTEGKELISSSNALFDKEYWSRQSESTYILGDQFDANLLEIVSVSGQKRFVLSWYQLDGVAYASRFKTKIYQAFDVMLARNGGGALIALSLPFVDANRDELRQRLFDEAKAFAPNVVSALPF